MTQHRSGLFLRRLRRWLLIGPVIWLLVLAALVAFGTAAPPPPLSAISEPMRRLDLTGLPLIQRYEARDGTMLAFRSYGAGGNSVVVLVHGSSGSSQDMHGLATAIAAAGAAVYAIDVRGHGASGRRGDIDYVGQLDDDLADFVAAVIRPAYAGAPLALVGFSSGGGFVLRFGSGAYGTLFDRYLLISPYLRYDAPTTRQAKDDGDSRVWARPFVPRIIGLSILHRLGVRWFDGLPAIAFAVSPGTDQTPTYSFRLLRNFGADDDYLGDFRHLDRPACVMVGADDELLQAAAFAPLLRPVRPDIDVTVLPGLGHMAMITNPTAFAAVRAALLR
jgi:pimeloyl-ACP methyl ester carboxylesterase